MAAPGVHEKVLSILERLPRGKVLDIAAGEGALSEKLKNMGFDVVAADIDPSQFSVDDIPCYRVDANERFPFSDNSFDYVVSVETIEHLERPYNLIKEAERVLKPGGYFILTTPNVSNIWSRLLFLASGRLYGFSKRSILGTGHISPIHWYILETWLRHNTQFKVIKKTYNRAFIPYLLSLPVSGGELFGQILIVLMQKRVV